MPDDGFSKFLEESKIYTFSSPQVFVAPSTVNEIPWSSQLGNYSQHFVQDGDSFVVHRNTYSRLPDFCWEIVKWTAQSAPKVFMTGVLAQIVKLSTSDTSDVFGVMLAYSPIKMYRGWFHLTDYLNGWLFDIPYYHAIKDILHLTYYMIMDVFVPLGVALFAIGGILWIGRAFFSNAKNDLTTYKSRTEEWGTIYYSPKSINSFYVPTDKKFLTTYSNNLDSKYRNGWFRDGKPTKSLDDVIKMHMSIISSKPNEISFSTQDGKVGTQTYIVSTEKTQPNHGTQPNNSEGTSSSAIVQYVNHEKTQGDHGTQPIKNDSERNSSSGFVQYTIFPAFIFLSISF